MSVEECRTSGANVLYRILLSIHSTDLVKIQMDDIVCKDVGKSKGTLSPRWSMQRAIRYRREISADSENACENRTP